MSDQDHVHFSKEQIIPVYKTWTTKFEKLTENFNDGDTTIYAIDAHTPQNIPRGQREFEVFHKRYHSACIAEIMFT